MRKLALFIAIISLTSQAAGGYPVYSMLKETVYKVYMGTAFVVKYKRKTYMITNWHVCNYFKRSKARNDELKLLETVSIVKTFPEKDLCVMTTARKDGLEIGKDVGRYAAVYTAGYPEYATTLQLRSGHTSSSLDREYIDYGPLKDCPKSFTKGAKIDPITKKTVATCSHGQDIMDTNLEGTGGNSGSPVVNSKGQLVGIVHSRSEGQPLDDKHNTLNYVPVSELVKALDSL